MDKSFEPIPSEVEAIAAQVIDAALKIHRTLGPGLLESVYEVCLCHELSKRQIKFERQRSWPIRSLVRVFDSRYTRPKRPSAPR